MTIDHINGRINKTDKPFRKISNIILFSKRQNSANSPYCPGQADLQQTTLQTQSLCQGQSKSQKETLHC